MINKRVDVIVRPFIRHGRKMILDAWRNGRSKRRLRCDKLPGQGVATAMAACVPGNDRVETPARLPEQGTPDRQTRPFFLTDAG